MSARPAIAEALAALYARVPLGMRLGTEAMREACARMGNPERAFEIVHVAGTNGKGSVAAMVESIARVRGVKTGMFSSPHLCRFAERIRIDGAPIDDETLAEVLHEVLNAGPDLSFFEASALAAFRAFATSGVELAAIEVGIGGRLDATNVIPPPRAAAITRIALDHMDRLGPTLLDIAREKAGIAKPGVEIVLGPMSAEVRAAIDEVATRAGASTVSAIDDPAAEAFAASHPIGLAGAHQRDNARVAYCLGARIGASAAEIAQGIANARWPGRLESIATPDGTVLIDAAHNPDGAAALARHLDSLGFDRSAIALLFGALADKAWAEMLDCLAPLAGHRVYVAPPIAMGPRSPTDPNVFAARHAGVVRASVPGGLRSARNAVGPGGLVVACGSIYLIGEVRAELLGLPRDPAVPL